MTLAHVGRFLTRPVQRGKRYDAQMDLVQSTAPALAASALVLFLPAPAAIFFGVPAIGIAVNWALCRIIPSLLSRTRPGRASPNSDLAAFTVLTTIIISKLFSDGSRSTSSISPDISLTRGVSRTLVSELNYDGAASAILCTLGQRAAICGPACDGMSQATP
jgi:hypothetical protein